MLVEHEEAQEVASMVMPDEHADDEVDDIRLYNIVSISSKTWSAIRCGSYASIKEPVALTLEVFSGSFCATRFSNKVFSSSKAESILVEICSQSIGSMFP